jgi:hypothetical protein
MSACHPKQTPRLGKALRVISRLTFDTFRTLIDCSPRPSRSAVPVHASADQCGCLLTTVEITRA